MQRTEQRDCAASACVPDRSAAHAQSLLLVLLPEVVLSLVVLLVVVLLVVVLLAVRGAQQGAGRSRHPQSTVGGG